jgi:hypothetical protein
MMLKAVEQSSGSRLREIKILVALKPGSGEARNLIGLLRHYADQEGCKKLSVLGSYVDRIRVGQS